MEETYNSKPKPEGPQNTIITNCCEPWWYIAGCVYSVVVLLGSVGIAIGMAL